MRSLQQDSMLKERAFLPINGDATAVRFLPDQFAISAYHFLELAVARFAPTGVVAHGTELSLFDSSTLQPVPGGSMHRNVPVHSLRTYS